MIIEETPEGRLLVDAWEVAQQTFFNIQGQINARMMRAFLRRVVTLSWRNTRRQRMPKIERIRT